MAKSSKSAKKTATPALAPADAALLIDGVTKAITKKITPKKTSAKKADTKKAAAKKAGTKKATVKKAVIKKAVIKKAVSKKIAKLAANAPLLRPTPPMAIGAGPAVLDRLWAVVESRRNADPASSHSARLLSRGMGKVAQKFGEESVECLIEAVAGNTTALVAESADVLYHLLVLWVAAGVQPDQVWAELQRREGVSGIAEKAARSLPPALQPDTTKIP